MNKNILTLKEAIGTERAILAVLCFLLAWFPYKVSDKLDLGWMLLIEAALFSIGFYFLKSYRKHLPVYMVILLLFCVSCELYIRVSCFGMAGLSFRGYRPAGYGNPFCNLEYNRATYTGLKPDTETIFKGKKFHINHHGFRGRSFFFTKSADRYRILMVGSSGTMGAGVSENNRFSQLVENELNAVRDKSMFEIINLSIPGTHIGNHLDVIKEIGLKYKPDMVMMLINRANSSKKKLVLKSRRPKAYEGPRHKLYTEHKYEYFRSSFFFARLLLLSRRDKLYFNGGGLSGWFNEKAVLFSRSNSKADSPSDWTELVHGIDMLKEICPEQRLVLYQLKPLDKLNDPDHDIGYRKFIEVAASERGIHVADTYGIDFSGHTVKDLTVYPGDVHPNEIVHKLYAKEILKTLKPILRNKNSSDALFKNKHRTELENFTVNSQIVESGPDST